MDNLLEYYKPILTADGFTLSIDKMAVDYMMTGPDALAALGRLLESLPIRFAVDSRHWESFKIGSFHENYTITFHNKNSFWLGVALNSSKTEWNRLRLEFNPNKCAAHASFPAVLSFLFVIIALSHHSPRCWKQRRRRQGGGKAAGAKSGG